MKICLTGHKNGLGKALFDQLRVMYDVVGFDYPDDLEDPMVEDRFFGELFDCDVVILSAPVRQLDFLRAIIEYHYNDPKKVIVIGSVAGTFEKKVDHPSLNSSMDTHKDAWDKYINDQRSVKKFVTEFQHSKYYDIPNTKLQISCLSLQQLDDPRSDFTNNRMPFHTVVDLVCDLIDNQYILNTEVWHA